MTKKILIVICLSTTLLRGMEPISLQKIPKKSFTLTYHKTTINLVQGDWKDALDTADTTVIGNHHHHRLKKSPDNPYKTIGTVCNSRGINYYEDNNYLLYRTKNIIMLIEEPCNYMRNEQPFHYYVVRKNQAFPQQSDCPTISRMISEKAEAIQEASCDLAFCYNTALMEGYNQLTSKLTQSITFTQLGTEVGFPRDKAAPIAIATICDFIKIFSLYHTINFVVKESDFTRYKQLLLQHSGILYNICLFYWKNKNENSTLSVFPPELIDYIVRLI